MSGYADTRGGEEYIRLDSFHIIDLSLEHTGMIKNGRKQKTLVCLGIKNEIIHSMPFCDIYFKNKRFLILLFGKNLKSLNSVQLQRLE